MYWEETINSSVRYRIHVRTTEGVKTHDLAGNRFVFGRSSKAQVKIVLDGISREHFKIEVLGDHLFLSDLKSSNGTVYQKKKISTDTPLEYTMGEKIQIPGVKLQVWIEKIVSTNNIKKEESRISDIAKLIEEESPSIQMESEIVPEIPAEQQTQITSKINSQQILEADKTQREELLQQAKKESELVLARAREKAHEIINESMQAAQVRVQQLSSKLEQEKEQFQRQRDEWGQQQRNWQQELENQRQEFEQSIVQRKKQVAQQLEEMVLGQKQKIELDRNNILEQAMLEAKKTTQLLQSQEQEKIDRMVADQRQSIEAKLQECQHWIQTEQQKIHQLRMDAMRESQAMVDEAQRQSFSVQEKAQKNALQYDIEAKEKSNLHLRQKQLEARELIKEAEQKNYLMAKELELQQQALAHEKQRQANWAQEQVNHAKQEAEQIKRKAQDDADAIIAGAMNTKDLVVQGAISGVAPLMAQTQYQAQQTHHELEREWKSLLEKEYLENKENIVKKITLGAREDSLKITASAHDNASQIVNEAYRQAGVIMAEGQRKYQILQQEKESLLAQREAHLQEITTQHEHLKSNIADLSQQNERLQAQQVRLTHENKELTLSMSKQSAELTHMVQSLQEKIVKSETLLEQLKTDVEQSQLQKVQILDDFNAKAHDLRHTITILEAELTPLQYSKDQILAQYTQLKEEHQQLYQRHQAIMAKEESSSESVHQLTLQLSQLEMVLNDKTMTLEETNRNLEEKTTLLESTILQEQDARAAANSLRESTTAEMQRLMEKTNQETRSLIEKTNKHAHEIKLSAEEELKKLLQEVALIKADREQYAVREINQMKEKNRIELQTLSQDAKRKHDEHIAKALEQASATIEAANLKAQDFAREMRDKNKSLIDAIDLKEKELQALMNKMQQVREDKMKEAQIEARQYCDKKQLEFNIQIENLKKTWGQQEQTIINAANVQAQKIKQDAQVEINQIKEQLKQKIAGIDQNAKAMIEEETQKMRQELERNKENMQRELTSRKVQELESINQLVAQEKRHQDKNRTQHVHDIAQNIDTSLRLKLKTILPPGQEQVLLGMEKMIETITRDVLYPSNDGSKRVGVLVGSGKVSSSVKNFWLKVAAAVLIPMILLIVHFVSPNFYSSIGNKLISAITPKTDNQENYMAQEMEKRRNRPKYNPPQVDELKATFTESLIFSSYYKEFCQDSAFEKKWTLALSKYFFEDLGLSENLVVKVIGTESAIHQTILPMTETINPDFADDAIKRMLEIETDSIVKMREHFQDPTMFEKYWAFKGQFYKKEVEVKRRQPAQATTPQ